MNIVGEYRRNPQRDAEGRTICWFYLRGECRFGTRCRFSHAEAVSPTGSPKQNQIRNNVKPRNQRVETTPSTMDTSSSTEELSCSICLEVVMERPNISDRTFGILPNCMHCFCFSCILEWRKNIRVAKDASQSCPECRTMGNYNYAGQDWFYDKDEKKSFIDKENDRMKNTDCRTFKNGRGRCRYQSSCAYRHIVSDGVRVNLSLPNSVRNVSSSTKQQQRQ